MSDETVALQPVKMQQGIVRSAGNVAEALKEYQSIQAQLDAAMPDCIMKIGAKMFRKKMYWRAIRTAFNLHVLCTKEELCKGDKDWGYVVTYRATAPNGSEVDGDGSCFASEKRGGQATVHNVRSHAHTRAFNRAVSNLVGFGEVSAEEVAHDGRSPEAQDDPRPTQEEAPQDEPGSSDGPSAADRAHAERVAANIGAAASIGRSGNEWTGKIARIFDRKAGASGKMGPYRIVGADGAQFSTFDKAHAQFAKDAGTSPVRVCFETVTHGKFENRNIFTIEPADA